MSSVTAVEALLARYRTGEYFSRLINHPSPHRWRRPPDLVYHATVNALAPLFTVVMPAFNHESSVQDSLRALAAAASLPFDCIVVDDGSEDRTAEGARAFFESRPARIAGATIIRNPVPVFETACDNLGLALAETDVIVEVQADMQVLEPAFDALLLRACAASPRPSAVSGRCGHTFRMLRPGARLRSLVGQGQRESIGLCGPTIETPAIVEPLKGRMFRCETVNRGPWVLFKEDLERHGYLDERHFFLGNDDHDYHRRLLAAEGRRPIYVPCSLHAPLALGAARRPRTGMNLEVFTALSAEKRGSPAFHHFLRTLGAPQLPVAITDAASS